MLIIILLQIYLIVLFKKFECNATTAAAVHNELKAVVVVYRHGDRTPVNPYPNDPYKNSSYWPVGFGQLTNIGKMQHYELGKWLRLRYENFLSNEYNPNEIRIISTDVDRTLMSAEANLAGLYPPKNPDQIWNRNIKWQPIPIHTIPELQDPILAMKQTCPKYCKLLQNLLTNNGYFRNITHKNHDLYRYLTHYSGTNIISLETLEYLYNTLMIEKMYNFTLPEWTRNVFPEQMQFSAELSFATGCYTKQLARLKTGLWYAKLIEFFKNHTTTTTTTNKSNRKMLIYSGHDITIANLLNTIGAFQLHCPPYASTILFELYLNNNNNDYFVNIFYKNSTTDLQKIVSNGCGGSFNCKLTDFIANLNDIVLNYNQWLIECQLNHHWWWFNDDDDDDDLKNFLLFIFLSIIIIISCLFSIIIVTIAISKCFKSKQHILNSYQQLPNNDDEVAA